MGDKEEMSEDKEETIESDYDYGAAMDEDENF